MSKLAYALANKLQDKLNDFIIEELTKDLPFTTLIDEFISFDGYNIYQIGSESDSDSTLINNYVFYLFPTYPHGTTNISYQVNFSLNSKGDISNIQKKQIQIPVQTNFIQYTDKTNTNLYKNMVCFGSKILEYSGSRYLIFTGNNPSYLTKDPSDATNVYYTTFQIGNIDNDNFLEKNQYPYIFKSIDFKQLFENLPIMPTPSHTFNYFLETKMNSDTQKMETWLYLFIIMQSDNSESYTLVLGKTLNTNDLELEQWNWSVSYWFYNKNPFNKNDNKSHHNGICAFKQNDKYYIVTTDRNGYVAFNKMDTFYVTIKSRIDIYPELISQSVFLIRFDKKNYTIESKYREIHNAYYDKKEQVVYIGGNSRATIVKIDFNNPEDYFNKNKDQIRYKFITTNLSQKINDEIKTKAVFGSSSPIYVGDTKYILVNPGTSGPAATSYAFGTKRISIASEEEIINYYGDYQTELLLRQQPTLPKKQDTKDN